MQFAYTAKTTDGDKSSGLMSADNAEDVRRQLRDQNMFPITISKQNFASDLFASRTKKPKNKIRSRELLNLTTQLAIMTRSGIDLASAIKSLARQAKTDGVRRTLEEIYEDISGGKSVSDSMRKHVNVFGEAYVASVAAGEAAGQLPSVFNRLSQLIRADIRNRSALVTLLSYPILLTTISSLVLLGLVCFVLPQFAEIFDQYDIELPLITQILIAISTEIRSRAWLWGPFFASLIFGVFMLPKTTTGKRLLDNAVLNFAIIKDVSRAILVGRTFRLLGLMIESGVPLLEGIRLTRASIKNLLYRELFAQIEEDIMNGRGFAASLSKSKFIPDAVAEMVMTAEKTGSLGSVTQLMGDHFEEEGESKLREFATILEPIIIVVMGVIVAVIVLSVMLPMFEMSQISG